MKYVRIMKYPGAKKSLLPDIRGIFIRSGCRNFIDVFGGSGLVSLNIRAENTVYNDLDASLYRTIKGLQDYPGQVFEELSTMISNRHTEDISQMGIAKEAALTIYRRSLSFGGYGETYATKEKSPFAYLNVTMALFPEITRRIASWRIMCEDFTNVFCKFNDSDSFFYLDPPYPGKSWYSREFTKRNYVALHECMLKSKGSYLLTIDQGNSYIHEVFGEPAFRKTYSKDSGKVSPRKVLFYTNVALEQEYIRKRIYS